MQLKTQWLLLALFSGIPYVLLGLAGAWWLYDSGWWLWWGAAAALISLIAWPIMKWLQRRTSLPMPSGDEPSQNWTPTGRAAWADVQEIADRLETGDVSLNDTDALLHLAREVVETVARRFHSRSKNPAFEIPVPHLLRIVELVAHDLRVACSANIPGSHILTINDLLKLKKLVTLAPTLYRVYRVAALIVNPATALSRELDLIAKERMLRASGDETRRWALRFVVRRAGYYAIELYSGQLVLRDVEFNAYTTPQSQSALSREQERTAASRAEPLRVLVLGQVKAGKSSLVNALFGETRAAVDVVPRTKDVDPYLLERDGIRRAIILDTAGYEDAAKAGSALEQARQEVLQSDLVLLVSSATSAARDADRRLLDDVRGLFQQHPDREFPPIVVALTHIDQLRPFREWNPPYDLTRPAGTKAEQIREAVETTAADLHVDVSRVIPTCLLEGKLYNVDEGLIPAILNSLGAAGRLKCLRCLREYKEEQYWTRLRQQAASAGQFLLKAGRQLLSDS